MGRLGKDNNPFSWGLALIVLAGLAGCAGEARNRRYAGPVDAQEGICGLEGGGKHLTGSLKVRGEDAIFAPDEGVVILTGKVTAAGHVKASVSTAGADHKPFLMVFEGDIRQGQVEGRYATPQCRATVTLHQVE